MYLCEAIEEAAHQAWWRHETWQVICERPGRFSIRPRPRSSDDDPAEVVGEVVGEEPRFWPTEHWLHAAADALGIPIGGKPPEHGIVVALS